jgi:hydroxymethylglutaryl-CoA reductase
LADRRKVVATCTIPADVMGTETLTGGQVIQGIVEAGAFAEIDPYRATTHNKGILNGMDAVCIATGNDWRALEAGAHAFAAQSGRYTSLTSWTQGEGGALHGRLEVPLAVGIVGGATRVHPTAKVAMKILSVKTAPELAEVIASVGLAQNLAAIRALATEGIQRGHMSLHARQMATAAGASGEMVTRVVETMLSEGNIRLERAKEIVAQLRGER